MKVKQWVIDLALVGTFLLMFFKATDTITQTFIVVAFLLVGAARVWAGYNERKQRNQTSS